MRKNLFLLFVFVALFSSCEKSEDTEKTKITLNATEISLHYDETYQFVLKQGDSEINNASWSSSDETVGTVNSSGLFTAKKIGQTEIKVNGVICKVSVLPYSTLCVEPYTVFNSTIANVKANEKRTLLMETNTGLVYSGENNKIKQILYVFENNKSTSAGLLFQSITTASEITTFLKERYIYLGYSDGIFIFTDNKKVAIGLSYSTSLGYNAIYIPYSSSAKTASVASDILTKLKDAQQQQLESIK